MVENQPGGLLSGSRVGGAKSRHSETVPESASVAHPVIECVVALKSRKMCSAVNGDVQQLSKSEAQFRICDCVNGALFRAAAANCTDEYFSVLVL